MGTVSETEATPPLGCGSQSRGDRTTIHPYDPRIVLDTLLERPGLPIDERLLIAAKCAIAPGAWDRLAECVRAGRERELDRALLDETLLQALLFFGFPRIVTAFEVLQREWPAEAPPSGGALPVELQAAAGSRLFDQIYAKNSDRVRAMLASFHQEFHDFVLSAAYGRILTRPGLTERQRELLATGALQALGQVPQLVAHARGALTFGATETEVREAIFTADPDEARADEAMRRILRQRQ